MNTEAMPENEYPEELKQIEEASFDSDDSNEQPPSDIVAFNEQRSCADLFRMHEGRQLEIQPDFQRDVVWPNAAQTRFIDSLSKQLPIPSMCISWDYKTGQRQVIDGLQRVSSLIKFLSDDRWRLSKLDDIDERLSGKRVEDIQNDNPEIYHRVENVIIPITVLRCDYSKQDHMEYMFTIFHRLNTAGNKLTNQEIRNCIFGGELNEILRELDQYPAHRDFFGLEPGKTYRFRYQEMILRFFAFVDGYKNYSGNLSKFLNIYMSEHQQGGDKIDVLADLYRRSIGVAQDKIVAGAKLPELSKATIEAILVGIASNIENLEGRESPDILSMFADLRAADEFQPDNLKSATTSRANLVPRMDKAVEVFSK